MKKLAYISSIVLLAWTITSCQKDELQQLGVESNTPVEVDRVADEDPIQSDDNSIEDRRKMDDDAIDINVKEVSDGDDESDDDETTSN